MRELLELCVTTDSLEDKTILEAPKYFSDWVIVGIGIFKRMLFVTLTLIFTVQIYYQTTKQQQFVGASLDAGNCETIVVTWNGNFIADRNGYWEGYEGYTKNLGMYLFTFQNLGLQMEQYDEFMLRLQRKLGK